MKQAAPMLENDCIIWRLQFIVTYKCEIIWCCDLWVRLRFSCALKTGLLIFFFGWQLFILMNLFFPNFSRCPISIAAIVIYIITQFSNDKKPRRSSSYPYFLACRCLFEFILNLFIWFGICWYFQVELDEPKLLNHFNYIDK